MLFSERWLRELVNPKLNRDELLHQLTMAGLEVDGSKPAAGDFSKVVVGEVLTVEKHPDADKLSVCQVQTEYHAEAIQIVCGAANVREGLKVAVALVGAVLPGAFKIKKSKLRGVESFGMLCAASELGLSESSSGLMELPVAAPVGNDLFQYLQLDDTIIEVDLTPNRGDCLGMLGLAREVGVLNQLDVKYPQTSEFSESSSVSFPVKLIAEEACPHYVGRVIKNVEVNCETPLWMVERLRRGGIRTIDPVVDVTNYVLLECGQPMHAFDFGKLEKGIEVRFAKEDESLVLLDGQELKLHNDTLVIADGNEALAIAGIMGGQASAVSQSTKDIFLESAFFAPVLIAGKARTYGLHTDSSHRFERGVDYQLQVHAMERATQLLLEIVGGEAGPITQTQSEKYLPTETNVELRKKRVEALLGIHIENEQLEEILVRLGMVLTAQENDTWLVKIPSYRFDITLEVDLIEEVGRIFGYNNLPACELKFPLTLPKQSEGLLAKQKILGLFANLGYQESICYSFVDQASQQLVDPGLEALALANPISAELAVMRTSLWPGLLKTYVSNQNRQQSRIRLFETGLVFNKSGDELTQNKKIAGLISGESDEQSWHSKGEKVDFYDLKGDLDTLFEMTGQFDAYQYVEAQHPALHPGQCAEIHLAGGKVGYIGAIHPDIRTKMGIEHDVFVFELDLDLIQIRRVPLFESVSKFPETTRDLAIIIDKSVSVQSVLGAIGEVNSEFLRNVTIFDVYEGPNIGKGKKSIALSLTLQHSSRTLEELEVTDLVDKIIGILKQSFNAILRD